ncbi:MAG: TolB family protein, partial [Anaerolineales bacterium]
MGSRPTGHPRWWPHGHFFFLLLMLAVSACQAHPQTQPAEVFYTPVLSSPAPSIVSTPMPFLTETIEPLSPLERLRVVCESSDGVMLWEKGASRLLTMDGRDANPTFSPDGEWIIFWRDESLWGVGMNGEARSLATADYLNLLVPSAPVRVFAWDWMPGTANLFFTTAEGTMTGWRPRFDLHVVDVRGGSPNLVLAAGQGGMPFVSPHGTWLALVREGEIALTRIHPLKPGRVFSYKSLPGYLPGAHWLRDESGFVVLIPPDPKQATPTPEPSSEYPALLPTRWWGISIEGRARLLGEFEAEKFSLASPLISPNGDQVLYLYPYRKRGQHELHIRDVLGNDLFYTSYRYGKIGAVA